MLKGQGPQKTINMTDDVPTILAVLSYPLTLLPLVLVVRVYDLKHPARPMRVLVHEQRARDEFLKYVGPS
jgi:hypothetical protein